MDVMEIISDSLVYPLNNIKALIIYAILGIILGLVLVFTGVGVAASSAAKNALAAGGAGIVGIIIAFIIGLLIEGYMLDVIKFGINRDSGAPGIDFGRQVMNGIKLIVVTFVYFIVPLVITFILSIFLAQWLSTLIGVILTIIFAFAAFMAQCRLAKTDDLGYALAFGEAIGDISRVGIFKILVLLIVMFIIVFIITFIIGAIAQFNDAIGGILMGVFAVYYVFFQSRATGLLYSDA